MNINIEFCCSELREARAEAKKLGIAVPSKMTAMHTGVMDWFLVEASGGFRKEVSADNAYHAKAKVISELIDRELEARKSLGLAGSK